MGENATLHIEYLAESIKQNFTKELWVEIDTIPFVIGRGNTCNLRIHDPELSRQHIKIYVEGERHLLFDLGSTNGVYINEERIPPQTPCTLRNDQILRLGNAIVFRFADPDMTEVIVAPKPYLAGGVWLDSTTRDIYVERNQLNPSLTATQFNLLALLFHNSDQVITRDQIANHLWYAALGDVSEDMIDNTVSRLRARLKEIDKKHTYIKTIRGVGYQFIPRDGQILPQTDRLAAEVE